MVTTGISRKGARILRQHGYEVRRRVVDAIDKTQDAGWRFIEHKVLITGFMTNIELALRNRAELGLLQRKDIGVTTRSVKNRTLAPAGAVRGDNA